MKYILGEGPLTRVWGEIQTGLGSEGFAKCEKGAFYARIRVAKTATGVDAAKLDIVGADLMEVPKLDSPPAWYSLLTWDVSSFPTGVEAIGIMECYAETRMGAANIDKTESALLGGISIAVGQRRKAPRLQ